MTEIDLLIHRYLEDRSSLDERELTALVAALKADPDLASGLRDQLMMDDLLAQKLMLDRRNCVAQVEQRIADLKRGPSELSKQTADLRSIAAAERSTGSTAGTWSATRFILALSALLFLGVTALSVRW